MKTPTRLEHQHKILAKSLSIYPDTPDNDSLQSTQDLMSVERDAIKDGALIDEKHTMRPSGEGVRKISNKPRMEDLIRAVLSHEDLTANEKGSTHKI